MARFECRASATEGDPTASHELVVASFWDNFSYSDPLRVSVVRQLFLSVPPGHSNRSRLLTLRYGETREKPWASRGINISYRVPTDELKRPLFGFLILDSGEYVVRLAQDETYREKIAPGTKLSAVHINPGYPKGSPDEAFLGALGKANSVAFELKYADGETVVRQTFGLKPTELMQRTLATVLEGGNCKYWDDPPDFHQ